MFKVPINDAMNAKSYYKYYEMEIEQVSQEQKNYIKQCKGTIEEGLSIQDRNKLLEIESHPAKIGYYPLKEGGILVAANMKMPGVKPEMLEWWFAWHGLEPFRYTIWDNEDHFDVQLNEGGHKRALDNSIPMREKTWGAVHTVQESVGGPPDEIVIMFMNPSDLGFDMSKYGTDGCKFIVAANALMGKMKVPVVMVETAAEINGELEYRTRFYVGYHIIDGEGKYLLPPEVKLPDEVAMGLIEHNIKEFSNLAKILPSLYEEEKENW